MGFLIGLEMPLVVRIRENLYKNIDSAKNTATVYAADCVGIAVGTFVWAAVLGHLDVTTASAAAALANAAAAALFMLRYYNNLKGKSLLATAFTICFVLILVVFNNGVKWEPRLASAIYVNTNTQHVAAPTTNGAATKVAFVAGTTHATVKP
jgi:predicted membrane-bound spermidine synthase